ncbi:MAG: MFS transporter, partial [Firmicutes bacterium]|nr:MFS transporter [Bacillota bacterium]
MQGTQSTPQPSPTRWWVLAATSFGLFMALLDVTIVNVALPVIQHNLHVSFASLQWIVNAYALTFAVGLITMSRLGDIFGRKKWFIIGLAIFTIGSLFSGLADIIHISGVAPITLLIAARSVQGLGAAGMVPLSLSIIFATFSGSERNMAIGIWGGISGVAVAIGPLVGGVLIQAISWPAIFYVNIPIGIIGITLSALYIHESRNPHSPRQIDWFGFVTLTGSTFSLIWALMHISTAANGWTSPRILLFLAAFVVLLAIFVIGELHLPHPMVDPRLFTNR